MKNKNKLIIVSSFISLLPSSFLVSCITTRLPDNTNKLIENKFNISSNTAILDEVRTKKFVEDLIKKTFKTNEVKKVSFLKSQEDSKHLFKEFKELSRKFFEMKNKGAEEKNKIKKKLQDFYSKNWLFIIENLKEFVWTYDSWWMLPTKEAKNNEKYATHSKEFIEKIKELNDEYQPKEKAFLNNYFNHFQEGDESRESSQAVFYLSKFDFLMRIFVSKNENDTKFSFDKFIYFPPRNEQAGKRTQEVSIKILSDAIHQGVIHGDKAGYDSFENVLVRNNGFPALGFLIDKEVWKEYEKTKKMK
ncbi:aromatic motif membrane protein [Metamycoplasma auris]|uniref:Aromatic cluster surface protein n=1 Tax=Metamycoplasma auris TaxID=51363 RepID=A0A2W7FZX4_9BACT|nr:aromatic motif membrane protein [Metamycoplasma auris]PZV99949.1 aromatic cluster surface protein [Metamycoplasma auris]